MAMRQWDGGPKHVKGEAGVGGFFSGALLGLAEGGKTLSLEQFQEEQRRETAEIEREAERVLEEKRYQRGRLDKLADRDEDRTYQGLLRAEKRGYEAADAEAKRTHEIELQELRNEGAQERSNADKLNVTERKKFEDDFQAELAAMVGAPADEWNLARRKLARDNPEALDTLRRFQDALRGAKTREEAVQIYDIYMDILLTGGKDMENAPATARGGNNDDPLGIR